MPPMLRWHLSRREHIRGRGPRGCFPVPVTTRRALRRGLGKSRLPKLPVKLSNSTGTPVSVAVAVVMAVAVAVVMDAVVPPAETTDAVAVPPLDAVAVTVTPALTTDAVAMPSAPMPDTAALDAKSAIAAHRDLPTEKLPEPQFN